MFRLEVKDKTFTKTGDIKIKCTATIHTIYWRSNEESIQGKSQQRDNGYFGYDTSRFWNSGMYLFIQSGLKVPFLKNFCGLFKASLKNWKLSRIDVIRYRKMI